MKAQKIRKFNDSIVYNIGRLYVLLNQYLTKAYAPFGLNPAKFNLLMSVKHIGKNEGISQIELGGSLCVSAANITKLIDGLEKKGYLVRLPSPTDRRVNIIKITKGGSRLLDRIWVSHSEALNALLGDFSEEERQLFNKFLERFKSERKNE